MLVKLLKVLPRTNTSRWVTPLSRGLYLIGGEECVVSEVSIEGRTETAIWRTAQPDVTYNSGEHFDSMGGTAAEILEEIRNSDKPNLHEMLGW